MYARPVQVHFKTFQFLAVTYDMEVLICVLTLFKRKRFFPLFKQILETKMTWSQPIIVREGISKNQNLCSSSR